MSVVLLKIHLCLKSLQKLGVNGFNKKKKIVNMDASNFCASCAVGEVIVESCDTNDLEKQTTKFKRNAFNCSSHLIFS